MGKIGAPANQTSNSMAFAGVDGANHVEKKANGDSRGSASDFHGYLRPGEALDPQRQNLVLPMPGSRHYALHLHPAQRQQQSKVGLSDESILLDSPLLPWLGDALMNMIVHPAYLLDLTYNKLVMEWKQTLIALGLPEKDAVLYQLRHAGPSYDRHQNLRALPEVKQRGRWATDSSVKR